MRIMNKVKHPTYDIEKDMRYLSLLSQTFTSVATASCEIINLEAILNLPKGTEHFMADLHGEYQAFRHILKNASGNIKRKVNELFGNDIRESEKKELCTLIYYPEEKLELIKASEEDIDDWYHITIHQLVKVCRDVSSKYTRSKVRKSLPADFSYIIEELLHERTDDSDKAKYVAVIVDWSTYHYGYHDELSLMGYPVGQPRHTVDGSHGGQRCMYMQRTAPLAPICQSCNA